MAFCVRIKEPVNAEVNIQEFIQVCAFTTTPTDKETYVLVALGDRNQVDDIDFVFSEGTSIEFNEVGVHIFNDVILNTCANIMGTFKKPGEYIFNVALLEQDTNELLDVEVAVVKVFKS
ncbi:hypothetical protein [Chengkuizengella sediminis]|uniref:hypothetical protein n=1 Tax=Chengkuizengella sediminis TaxID=1885917 RepID=UPI0013898E60|nr:hypothetical protein [Chengkuizengella sediminis]NDI35886.1 hypothetical protein [Chengkuizengella sediminis]